MSILSTGLNAWRNYVIDNLPASGPNNPKKEDIREFVAAVGALDPVPGQILALQSNVSTLLSAQASGHVAFASKAAMDAAVGGYAQGAVAECYDGNAALAGVYIRQATATWGARVSPLPISSSAQFKVVYATKAAMDADAARFTQGTVAECNDSDFSLAGTYVRQATASWGARTDILPVVKSAQFEMDLRDAVPSLAAVGIKPAAPVVMIRLSQTDWLIRTPIVGGFPGEYTEWLVRDIGADVLTTRLLCLSGISTNENGVRRRQSNGDIHGSVFEYAMAVGPMADPVNTYIRYGNGHGFVDYTGLSMQIDGGANLRDMSIGKATGSSLTIAQSFNIRLPKDNTTIIGNINQAHIFDANGCTFSAIHTITAPNIGNMNSYSAMLPLTACNKAKFGAHPAIDINLFDNEQSLNQGQNTTIQAWHTDRPDLLVEMILPNGTPGSPDGWSRVTTTDEFAQNNPTFSKLYVNYRSGNSAVAAVTSSHSTLYRVRKQAA